MKTYRIKESIRAIQFNGINHSEVMDAVNDDDRIAPLPPPKYPMLQVRTAFGNKVVEAGDYVVIRSPGDALIVSEHVFEAMCEECHL